jgi:post-segregation antitoxin (ccd killing protein)
MRMKKQRSDPAEPSKRKQTRGLHIGAGRPARRRAANVAIDEEILAAAKSQGINLAQTLENELRKRTQDERDRRWQRKNRKFIDSYNRLIERAGVFGEEFQDWDGPGTSP